jgi:protein-tyrosine phosphatase
MITLDEAKKRITISGAIEASYIAKNIEDTITINVAEPEEVKTSTVDMPLFSKDNWYNWEKGSSISIDRLNSVASVINLFIETTNKKVNVNCTAGIERSPLSVVWYFHTCHNLSIEESYRVVKEIRPQAEDRRAWVKYKNYEEWQEHNAK